jgi:hypothetical protein
MAFKRTRSTAEVQKEKKHKTQAERLHSSKDPRYNLRPLANVTEDILHIYSGHNGSSRSEAANQLYSFRPVGMIQKLVRHLIEVKVGVKL